MAAIRHTFLFDVAEWTARGTFFDGTGAATPVEGRSQITHDGGVWLNRSFMRLMASPPLEFTNEYVIAPFAPDALATSWESRNPLLGRLVGSFALVGDSILSTYASEDRLHSGSECLQMTDAGLYLGRGVLYRESALFSAWIVELRRDP